MIYELKAKFIEVFEREKSALRKLLSRDHDLVLKTSEYAETAMFDVYDPKGNIRGAGEYSERRLSYFCLTALPGDGDVVVSHGVSVDSFVRGKGLGTLLHNQRVEAARAAGASCMLCTVRSDNEPERTILFKNGWRQMGSYQSHAVVVAAQTYMVEFWIKEL